MKKVLFVCHGNICRSPMAESVFKQMLKERGLTELFSADSAAVSSEELGNPVYPPAQRELERRGLPRSGHHAWQLSRSDYARYDYFLGMDAGNMRLMRRIFGGDPQGKVKLLMSYTGRQIEVEDPWYTDRFDFVFDEISRGCEAFLDAVLEDAYSAK